MPRPIQLFALLCPLAFACFPVAFASEPVEGSPLFFARNVVPDVALKTAVYTVSPLVEVNGFAYEFRIASIYGDFRARGIPQLRKLLHELEVVAMLAEVSQGGAFASSLSDRFTEPVAMTIGVARRPIASVMGLPGGVIRYLGGKIYKARRSSGKAMETYRDFRTNDDAEATAKEEEEPPEKAPMGERAGNLGRKHLGYEDAKRKWARDLKVDPYSDNEVLQQALGRIAWASSLGSFLGGSAVPSSEFVSYAGQAREMVWDRPAFQLERENLDLLKKLDVSKELMLEFRDTTIYSLSEKTELCLAFDRLSASGAASFLVDYSLGAESEEDADLFIRTLSLLVDYSEEVGEIVSIGERRGMLFACSDRGYDVFPLAVDYLHWSPLLREALLSEELQSEKREIWVSGTVSPIARHRLAENNWLVFDGVGP